MAWLPTLAAWPFAVAGLACASLPIVIHLLNRRRFRVVHWAAMDFLREAMQRNRRILQLRDWLLLAIRTLAVLLFGLALARPYFSSRNESFDGSQPLHAVLLIDNSLSMGYQSLRGTALDEAKERARELIDKLPRGSRISLVPLCGSRYPLSVDPYETSDSALEALARIETVDRGASMPRALNEARRALANAPELAPRVVLLSDQQRANWIDMAGDSASLADLPPIQVVDVSPETFDNAWISDLRLQDGLADVETPTTIVAEVQYRGAEPRRDVEVKLLVEGREVAAKLVTLVSGEGAQQVSFEHVFNAYQPEPGQQLFVPISVAIPPDNLPDDDARHLVAPIVAALPVVFVDQVPEAQEDPLQHRLGETRHLRRLLAPALRRQDSGRHLVRIRHVTMDDVTVELLADARLVVVAGVAGPTPEAVRVLREYVRQGGQLFLAAGADFDPNAWNQAAWLDGAGILPVPLKSQPIGALPEEAGERLKPFSISYESLAADSAFKLPDTAEDDLRDLYNEPFFFKAVDVDFARDTLDALRVAERERGSDEQRRIERLLEDESAAAKQAGGETGSGDSQAERERQAAWRELRPNWLRWKRGDAEASDSAPEGESPEAIAAARARRLDEQVERSLPRALARFTSEEGPPFLVERRIGAGRVLFATSGLLSSWNTLPKTNTMFLLDRLLRSMIHDTLPTRNFDARPALSIGLPGADGQMVATLERPGDLAVAEPLDIGFITRDERGVTIPQPLLRGVYSIRLRHESDRGVPAANSGVETSSGDASGTDKEGSAAALGQRVVLAVNGPDSESDLTRLPRERFDELAGEGPLHWVDRGAEISLAGAQIRGQDSWWFLIALVLMILLAELAILARPAWLASRAAGGQAAGGQAASGGEALGASRAVGPRAKAG